MTKMPLTSILKQTWAQAEGATASQVESSRSPTSMKDRAGQELETLSVQEAQELVVLEVPLIMKRPELLEEIELAVELE